MEERIKAIRELMAQIERQQRELDLLKDRARKALNTASDLIDKTRAITRTKPLKPRT